MTNAAQEASATYNSGMSFAAFLSSLFEHGRVKVAHPQEHVPTDEIAMAGRQLGSGLASWPRSFPAAAAAGSAGGRVGRRRMLYRGCQLAIYRELDAGAIDELLGLPCPPAEPASRHWSADLAFVFLPDLVRQSRRPRPRTRW